MEHWNMIDTAIPYSISWPAKRNLSNAQWASHRQNGNVNFFNNLSLISF